MVETTYERLTPGGISTRTEAEHLARYRFAKQFVRDKNVADVACGTGYGTHILAIAGAKSVLGVDISDDAVRYSIANSSAPNVSYRVANAQDLAGIPDCEFDVVVSFETIEHLPDVQAYLAEMLRITRPGGIFLVSTPDRRIASVLHMFLGRPKNPFHFREYTERELLNSLSLYFQIESIYGQAFVRRWLVFWPVQVLIKIFCRALGASAGRRLRDYLYNNAGNVEVIEYSPSLGIANFWIVACIRHVSGNGKRFWPRD